MLYVVTRFLKGPHSLVLFRFFMPYMLYGVTAGLHSFMGRDFGGSSAVPQRLETDTQRRLLDLPWPHIGRDRY